MMQENRQTFASWRGNLTILTRAALFLAVALAIQMLGMPQPVTGSLVNAILLLAVAGVSIPGAVAVGLATPWIAFMRGILPAPLGPMIPFIMLGNTALVVIFGFARRALPHQWLLGTVSGIAAGVAAKYVILSGAVRFLVQVPPPIAVMMQAPQLITGFLGGLIFLLVDRGLARTGLLVKKERQEETK